MPRRKGFILDQIRTQQYLISASGNQAKAARLARVSYATFQRAVKRYRLRGSARELRGLGREALLEALREAGGNWNRAAELLGRHRATLQGRAKGYRVYTEARGMKANARKAEKREMLGAVKETRTLVDAAGRTGRSVASFSINLDKWGMHGKIREIRIYKMLYALADAKGVIEGASRILGIHRSTFWPKAKRLGIEGFARGLIKEAKTAKRGEAERARVAEQGEAERARVAEQEAAEQRKRDRAYYRMLARLRESLKRPPEIRPREWTTFQREVNGFLPDTAVVPVRERILSSALSYWSETFQHRAQIRAVRKALIEAHPDHDGSARQFRAVKRQWDSVKGTTSAARSDKGWPSIQTHKRAEKQLERKKIGSVVSIGRFRFIKTSRGPVLWEK